jgi:hypothetical protein
MKSTIVCVKPLGLGAAGLLLFWGACVFDLANEGGIEARGESNKGEDAEPEVVIRVAVGEEGWVGEKDFQGEDEGGGLEARDGALRCCESKGGGDRITAIEVVRELSEMGGGEEGGEEGGGALLKKDPPHDGGTSTVVLALALRLSIVLL